MHCLKSMHRLVTLKRYLSKIPYVVSAIGMMAVSFPSFSNWEPVEPSWINKGRKIHVPDIGFFTINRVQADKMAVTSDQLRLLVTESSHQVINADGVDGEGRPYFDVHTLGEAIRIEFELKRGTLGYEVALYQFLSDDESPDPVLGSAVSFTNASVHDPSVIRLDDGTFYVFGSHLAAAKSDNLMDWQVVTTDGVNDANPLFDTYATQAAEGIAWSGGHIGSWAADVVQLADGNYYFYYNHCASPDTGNCDASRSYLGVAKSSNIEGPYENLGLILKSGHVGDENPGIDGQVYNGNIHPNAIDPDVFFDKEGRLWMVYGSYSGGIWVMEMDPTTGFALPGQGYGTKIMGGYYSAIEGPYMLYSPDTDYYYLFTSFGGFAQNDGYNMRISRSRNPWGPFEDASGQDMIGASGGWSSIAPYGVKLLGGIQWDVNPGEPGSDNGYMAPGHNSAYYDPESGKYFVIFHTRFPDRGEGHEIRVHELFINADDWLVVSPHRYVEQIVGDNVVDPQDAAGVYRYVNQGKDINRTPKVSRYLRLEADGSIGGDVSGSYTLEGDNLITLNVDGEGQFKGVMAWQYNDNIQKLVPTFTALASNGETVLGTALPEMSTKQALEATRNALSVPAVTSADLILPTRGAYGSSITWTANFPDVISSAGEVTRPNPGEPDKVVWLVAEVELNGKVVRKRFKVTVEARQWFNRIAYYQFENNLTDTLGLNATATSTGVTPDLNDGIVQYSSGEVGQAVWLDGSAGVRLPDGLIDNYSYTVSLWLNPSVLNPFTPAFFGAQSPDNWLSLVPWSWDGNTMLWSGSQAWYDASTGLQIPADDWSHLAFTVEGGQIRVYVNGVLRFTGSNFQDLFTEQQGVFTLGVNYWDLPFNGLVDELAIYDTALSANEILALDINRLPVSGLLDAAANGINLGDLNAVTENLTLPEHGEFTSLISWQTSDPSIITADGQVTRPGATEPDAMVTLTATIRIGEESITRDFLVTVRSLAPVSPIAEYNFDNEDLTEAQSNFAAGQPTGAFIGTPGAVSYTAGVQGQALMLDGTSGVQLAENLITDYSYSVSVWLNPQALTMFTPAFFGYASGDSWVSLVPNGHDGVAQNTMVWSGTLWYDAGMGSQIPINEWSHLVMVVNNGVLRAYLNGVEVFNGIGFPDVFSSGGVNNFSLGVNYWDIAFKGLIDEFKVYDFAITADDVQQIYSLEHP